MNKFLNAFRTKRNLYFQNRLKKYFIYFDLFEKSYIVIDRKINSLHLVLINER